MREVLSEELISEGVDENGTPYKHTRRHIKNKPDPIPEPPSMMRKAMNFGKAAIRHVLNGAPKSTSEVIMERLSICQSCELFKMLPPKKVPKHLSHLPVGTCMHKSCGCFIHRAEVFPNKLAWADQACPLNKWGEAVVSDPHYIQHTRKVGKPNE